MANPDRIIYPTPKYVQDFHDVLIKPRGYQGWVSRGMVQGCIEWVKTDVYQFIPFPTLLTKISALMYAYINFHPFTDGNKRTALMTTTFFCFINGYEMTITDDAPEFTRDVARRTADNLDHDTAAEIQNISDWLEPRMSTDRLLRFTNRMIHLGLPKDASEEVIFASPQWRIYYRFWYSETMNRLMRYIR
jgi:death-on-curing family protein